MNKLTLFVIISIFVIICLSKIYIVYCKNKLEHLTVNSDEAIQNLASLYNTDQLTIGKINATGKVESEQIQSKFIKTDRLQLGDKWILTGSGKDAAGVDDTWLRFMNPGQTKEPAGGGIAVGTIYDYSMANTIKGYVDAMEARVNARMDGGFNYHDGLFVKKNVGYKLYNRQDAYMWGLPIFMTNV